MENNRDLQRAPTRLPNLSRFFAGLAVSSLLLFPACKSTPDVQLLPTPRTPSIVNSSVVPTSTPEKIFRAKLIVSIELSEQLGKTGLDQVHGIFQEYLDMYGCPVNVNLSNKDFSRLTELSYDGKRIIKVFGESGNGNIALDFKALTKGLADEAKFDKFINHFLFNLSFACRETGVDGLSNKSFNIGAAGALAHFLKLDYLSDDSDHENLAQLVIFATLKWSSPKQLSEKVQKNDKWGFIEMFTGVKTQAGLRLTTDYFIRAVRGEGLTLELDIEKNHK
jgi:hypothetical protein